MKKLLTIAVASIAVAAAADSSYSPSIGVTSIDLSQKNNVIPVQFTSLKESVPVKAGDLVCTNNIPLGSHLYVYDDGYTAWELRASGWVGLNVVSSTAADDITYSGNANMKSLSAGSAIWLSFPAKPNSAITVAVYGQVATSASTEIAVGTSEAPKSTLICNPTSSSVALADKVSSLSLAKGDTIQPLGATFSGNYVYSGLSWTKIEEGKITKNATLPSLDQYTGCWFVSKGGSGTITW